MAFVVEVAEERVGRSVAVLDGSFVPVARCVPVPADAFAGAIDVTQPQLSFAVAVVGKLLELRRGVVVPAGIIIVDRAIEIGAGRASYRQHGADKAGKCPQTKRRDHDGNSLDQSRPLVARGWQGAHPLAS